MSFKTPTLPTVIITPCTPLYLLPTRSTYRSSSPSSSSSSTSSSSTRQCTRKQHLISALELGPSLFPHPDEFDEKPNYSLLLPSPAGLAPKQQRRRTGGVLLSLLVLGVFGLVLVGPMLPYRWYAGVTGAEVPALIDEVGDVDTALDFDMVAAEPAQLERRQGEAYGPGQGSAIHYADTFGPGQAFKRAEEEEHKPTWRSTMMHGLEWALLD